MLFALICTDGPDKFQTRVDTRPAHVAFLEGLNADGKLAFAGPFLGPDDRPNGSLVVIEAETEDEARAISGADPYAEAGLFTSVEIRRWNWTFNKPGNE